MKWKRWHGPILWHSNCKASAAGWFSALPYFIYRLKTLLLSLCRTVWWYSCCKMIEWVMRGFSFCFWICRAARTIKQLRGCFMQGMIYVPCISFLAKRGVSPIIYLLLPSSLPAIIYYFLHHETQNPFQFISTAHEPMPRICGGVLKFDLYLTL